MPVWKRWDNGKTELWIFPMEELQVGDIVHTVKTRRLILGTPIKKDERLWRVNTLDILSMTTFEGVASHFGHETKVYRDGILIYDGLNPPPRE